jgi:hypothetical protein
MIETPPIIELENSKIQIHEFNDAEEIRFLSKNGLKYCFYFTINILTLGFSFLLFHWLELHVYLYNKEEDFEHSTHVLVVTKEDKWIIIEIQKETFKILPINSEDLQEPSKKSITSKRDLKRKSNLQVINEDEEKMESLKEHKITEFLQKKEKRSTSGLDYGEDVLSQILQEINSKNEDLNISQVPRDSREEKMNLLNPDNKILLSSKGSITKRYISFSNRKYFFDESNNLFVPLETVFETHILRKPELIYKFYRYGNNAETSEELLKTFNKNKLQIQQNALLYDVIISLFHPMNFGILLLVIICYICNKMAEAIGKFRKMIN